MRFYEIIVFNDDGSQFFRCGSFVKGTQNVDPGALEVEVDIHLASYDLPKGQNAVTIYGIGLQTIGQSHQFAGKSLTVALGMSKGLPLANPGQQGAPIKGTVFQGFGNWSGLNQTLDLVFTAPTGNNDKPFNIVVNWQSGTKLSQAVGNTLKVAFPNLKQNIKISDKLVINHDEAGTYNSLAQFAYYVYGVSVATMNMPNYQGVKISIANGSINVYDATDKANTVKEILYTDLIGQPTWLDAGTVQIHCVMRGDIVLGDTVKLPATQQAFTAASNSQFVNALSFNGEFIVADVRLVGKFRDANAESWITVINLARAS